MKAAREVHAVLIDPVPSFEGHGPEPGADLAAYLARHGIKAVVHRLPREGKETGEMLRRTASDLGADLIVMGGFGHSRLRERIFGGTTTSMIEERDRAGADGALRRRCGILAPVQPAPAAWAALMAVFWVAGPWWDGACRESVGPVVERGLEPCRTISTS